MCTGINCAYLVYNNKVISSEYYSTLLKSRKLKHVILKNISYLCYIYKRYFSELCMTMQKFGKFFILINSLGLQFLHFSLLKCCVHRETVHSGKDMLRRQGQWEYELFLFLVNDTQRRKKYFNIRG